MEREGELKSLQGATATSPIDQPAVVVEASRILPPEPPFSLQLIFGSQINPGLEPKTPCQMYLWDAQLGIMSGLPHTEI